MYPRYSLALAALALVPVVSFAADADPDAVVVTATRFKGHDSTAAVNVSVISRDDIRNSPALNLPELLTTRAGIDVRQLGGVMGRDATVDMRGFGATGGSNTLILIDGQRVNPVDMGSIIWSAIPLESVDRVEIIRGAGTVLYGDGATGGVINIITNKSGRPVAGITTSIGNHGYRGADIQLANSNEQAYYNLFVSYGSADGYRRNSEQDQSTASGRVGFMLDRGEVFADFAVYKESEGLPGSLLSAGYRSAPRSTRFPLNTENRDGYRVRPGISYQVSDKLLFEAEVGVEHQNLKSNIVSSNYVSDRVRDTMSFTPRVKWQHGLGGLGSETVLGFDFYDSDVSSKNVGAPGQGASQTSSSVYLQNTTGLTSALSMSTGFREQRVRQSARQDAYAAWFSPAMSGNSTRSQNAYDLGLAYAKDNWRVYGKTGKTYRFANTDELFGFDTILYVPIFAGDIKPQHGTINEVGGSASVGPVKMRASVYRLDLIDEIGYDGALGANTNFSPTRRNGAELEADWKLSEDLNAKFSYSYTDAFFRSGAYSGKSVPLVPRNQASAQLVWNAGAAGTYTGALRYVGERRYGSDFDNSHGMLAGYATLDLQAVWNLKPWKLSAKVLNALDKKYAPFAGYSASYNDTYYYPADGRSFVVSARYDF